MMVMMVMMVMMMTVCRLEGPVLWSDSLHEGACQGGRQLRLPASPRETGKVRENTNVADASKVEITQRPELLTRSRHPFSAKPC